MLRAPPLYTFTTEVGSTPAEQIVLRSIDLIHRSKLESVCIKYFQGRKKQERNDLISISVTCHSLIMALCISEKQRARSELTPMHLKGLAPGFSLPFCRQGRSKGWMQENPKPALQLPEATCASLLPCHYSRILHLWLKSYQVQKLCNRESFGRLREG